MPATGRTTKGTEQAGAQQFLGALLQCYDVEYTPGTIFERHPVRVPERATKRAQASLFDGGAEDKEDAGPRYTTKRMDMYLPKICVWEMKSPFETDLQRHHAQLLGYWARMRPRYMVLCNFAERWIYDTNEEDGQLVPKVKLALADLPAHGDALLFLKGETPDLDERAERVTATVARLMGRFVRELIAEHGDDERSRDRVARTVLECVFAMFAEDAELLPPNLFTEAMRKADLAGKMAPVWQFFDDFATKSPSERANRFAPYVNGPLFRQEQPRPATVGGAHPAAL